MKTTIQKTELEKGVHKQDENRFSRDRARKGVHKQDENHYSIDRAQKKAFISKMKTTIQKTELEKGV
ncbi:hypothetical protein, partial [Niallia circulans]